MRSGCRLFNVFAGAFSSASARGPRFDRMYVGRGSSYSWGMGELILWKQITAELNGHTVIGLYNASRDGLVTGRTPYESKSRQLVGSSAALTARILLRELALEGKVLGGSSSLAIFAAIRRACLVPSAYTAISFWCEVPRSAASGGHRILPWQAGRSLSRTPPSVGRLRDRRLHRAPTRICAEGL